jgi:hypothetical protein
VPELNAFANLELKLVYNKDSSNCGPAEWKKLAIMLHEARNYYDAFLVIHGTDTMAYTAAALSLMLVSTTTTHFASSPQESLVCQDCLLGMAANKWHSGAATCAAQMNSSHRV